MNRIIALLLCSASLSQFAAATSGCNKVENSPKKPSASREHPSEQHCGRIEEILSKMQNATKQLKSCEAKLAYLFIQDPDLLETKTLQNGILYYQKDNDRSRLRIRFNDIKQDDFDPEKRREEFLFDGVWLTRIDFKLKQIDRVQKATKGKPIGVFDLISHNFPLVGFSNIDQLSKEFDVRLPEITDESDTSITLFLSVKKGSKYENDYKKIDFHADAKTYLPRQIVAYSSQGDIYDIKFTELKINKKLKSEVFTIETPPDFRENVEPMKKQVEPTPK